VFVAGIGGRPAGAVKEMVPEYVPAVAFVNTVPSVSDNEQPPTAGELIVPAPTTLADVMLADVAPDELHEAVEYCGVDAPFEAAPDALCTGAGVADEPPHPVTAKPTASSNAEKTPDCSLLVYMVRSFPSAWTASSRETDCSEPR
jgi:hypothetical protein